jgi:hypothetical protein
MMISTKIIDTVQSEAILYAIEANSSVRWVSGQRPTKCCVPNQLREWVLNFHEDSLGWGRNEDALISSDDFIKEVCCALPKTMLYEEDLPDDIDDKLYEEWFKLSRVVHGVRMGPRLCRVKTLFGESETIITGRDSATLLPKPANDKDRLKQALAIIDHVCQVSSLITTALIDFDGPHGDKPFPDIIIPASDNIPFEADVSLDLYLARASRWAREQMKCL